MPPDEGDLLVDDAALLVVGPEDLARAQVARVAQDVDGAPPRPIRGTPLRRRPDSRFAAVPPKRRRRRRRRRRPVSPPLVAVVVALRRGRVAEGPEEARVVAAAVLGLEAL